MAEQRQVSSALHRNGVASNSELWVKLPAEKNGNSEFIRICCIMSAPQFVTQSSEDKTVMIEDSGV